MYRKCLNHNCSGNRRDKVALKTTRISNVNFKIIKTGTGVQYVGYFCYSENLNWPAQNPRLGRMRTAVVHRWSKFISFYLLCQKRCI